MVFNSYVFFLIILPLFLAGFFLLKERDKAACKWWIICISAAFFVPFGIKNVLVLSASILVNALFAMTKLKDGRIFLAAISVNLTALLFFKFSGVFFPIAISFYTFNQISYLADMHRGEIDKFEPADYLCYVLFFPKILQGPLMGYGDFVKELKRAMGTDIDYERLLRGLYLFSMGLFKKVILADTFGKAVNYGFGNIQGLGSLEAVLVAVFYSFQLYFDFSGYCDMAAAICMMIGFELPLNFDSPYKAVNILDFWKRWHITLTRFFTKYVYIPLGGNRRGAVRMYVNFMIVFLLSGLWHGNGLTFIVWGAMHGVLYVLTRLVGGKPRNVGYNPSMGNDKQVPKVMNRLWNGAGILLTFIYVTLAWLFFRAENLKDAVSLIGRIFTGGRKPIATQLSSCFQLDELWYVIKVTPVMKLSFAWDVCLWLFLAVAAAIIFFAPNAVTVSKKCRIGVGTTLCTAVLLIWSILSFAGVSTFLYMNF